MINFRIQRRFSDVLKFFQKITKMHDVSCEHLNCLSRMSNLLPPRNSYDVESTSFEQMPITAGLLSLSNSHPAILQREGTHRVRTQKEVFSIDHTYQSCNHHINHAPLYCLIILLQIQIMKSTSAPILAYVHDLLVFDRKKVLAVKLYLLHTNIITIMLDASEP